MHIEDFSRHLNMYDTIRVVGGYMFLHGDQAAGQTAGVSFLTYPQGSHLIYAIGAVRKAGGFVLGEHESISALQALALAEGLDRAAAAQNARILRATSGSANRAEIPVDIKKILAGVSADVALKADDILFIPTSASRNVALRTFEAAVQIGTGVAIYRR